MYGLLRHNALQLRCCRDMQSCDHAESVTIAADGHLVMLDKYGYVHEATEGKHGQFELSKQPVAYVGPGRPLGAQFDTDGNLIICDSLKVLAPPSPTFMLDCTCSPLLRTVMHNSIITQYHKPGTSWNEDEHAPHGMFVMTVSSCQQHIHGSTPLLQTFTAILLNCAS